MCHMILEFDGFILRIDPEMPASEKTDHSVLCTIRVYYFNVLSVYSFFLPSAMHAALLSFFDLSSSSSR